MTEEDIRKGRDWLAKLALDKAKATLTSAEEVAPSLSVAVRRIPGSARAKIEEERKTSPAPMLKLNPKDEDALVREAEHGGNFRIESTVVRREDFFLPYPFAALPGAEPDLVE